MEIKEGTRAKVWINKGFIIGTFVSFNPKSKTSPTWLGMMLVADAKNCAFAPGARIPIFLTDKMEILNYDPNNLLKAIL